MEKVLIVLIYIVAMEKEYFIRDGVFVIGFSGFCCGRVLVAVVLVVGSRVLVGKNIMYQSFDI